MCSITKQNRQKTNTRGKYPMKINQSLTLCGICAALFMSARSVSAQTNSDNASGNTSPAQQRFLVRVHNDLGFTNETEWNAVRPLLEKVFEAQRDVARGGGMSRVLRDNSNGANANVHSGVRNVLFGQPSPEAQALAQAIDDNAPNEQIEAALAKYQAEQKARKDKLLQAQEDLRKALNPKREAQATLLRLLD
jgi:multidrug resistance efflux pump